MLPRLVQERGSLRKTDLMPQTAQPPSATPQPKVAPQTGDVWPRLFAAWFVSLAATLGALFIGEVMGQTPCLLCWYQRILMFPLAVILAIASFRSDAAIRPYVLALAAMGWLIAAYHGLLYAGLIPAEIEPCGAGPSCSGGGMTVFGAVPIPYLSVASFTAILLLLLPSWRSSR
ncbi:disulfide bond formation protein B [Falsiroseomonas tokyonensis]|uniref:Disulfide bond formation protein B n=1 Tax=Falsiroseomonas tokyonensis TaxID=430521 RepID=A0ABV7C4G3_9PROT